MPISCSEVSNSKRQKMSHERIPRISQCLRGFKFKGVRKGWRVGGDRVFNLVSIEIMGNPSAVWQCHASMVQFRAYTAAFLKERKKKGVATGVGLPKRVEKEPSEKGKEQKEKVKKQKR